MNKIKNLDDLKRNFNLIDLLYDFDSGGLEIKLRHIGETEKADKIKNISRYNAYTLVEIYKILGINPEMTEDEVRKSVI